MRTLKELRELRDEAYRTSSETVAIPRWRLAGLIGDIELDLLEAQAGWLRDQANASPLTLQLLKHRVATLQELLGSRDRVIARKNDQIAKLKRNLRRAYAGEPVA